MQGTANQFVSRYAGRLEPIWPAMVAKEELTIHTLEGVNSNVKLMLMDKFIKIRVGRASFSKTSPEMNLAMSNNERLTEANHKVKRWR